MSSLVRSCHVKRWDRESRGFRLIRGLQLAHSSVMDYLISPRYNPRQHKFQETCARADILRICLAYLGTFALGNPHRPEGFSTYLGENLLSHAKFRGVENEAHEQILKFLILNGFKIQRNVCWFLGDSRYGGPPLYVCSALGLTWTAKQLLKEAVDANEEKGEALATEASVSPYYQELIAKYIPKDLEVFTDFPSFPGTRSNALCVACYCGHDEIVRMLLDNGAKIKAALDIDKNPLWLACIANHRDIAKLLLVQWPDDNAKGRHLGDALIAACKREDLELVRSLLDSGADVNLKHRSLGSALHVASYESHEAIVEILIAAGADVNAQGGTHKTVLQAACSSPESRYARKEISKETLLQNAADPYIQNNFFATVPGVAAYLQHNRIIRLLLINGANLNVVEEKFQKRAISAIEDMAKEKKEKIIRDAA